MIFPPEFFSSVDESELGLGVLEEEDEVDEDFLGVLLGEFSGDEVGVPGGEYDRSLGMFKGMDSLDFPLRLKTLKLNLTLFWLFGVSVSLTCFGVIDFGLV